MSTNLYIETLPDPGRALADTEDELSHLQQALQRCLNLLDDGETRARATTAPTSKIQLSPRPVTASDNTTLLLAPAFPGCHSARYIYSSRHPHPPVSSLAGGSPTLSLPDTLYYQKFFPDAQGQPATAHSQGCLPVFVGAETGIELLQRLPEQLAKLLQTIPVALSPRSISIHLATNTHGDQLLLQHIQKATGLQAGLAKPPASGEQAFFKLAGAAPLAIFVNDYRYPDALAAGVPVWVVGIDDEFSQAVNLAMENALKQPSANPALLSDAQTLAFCRSVEFACNRGTLLPDHGACLLARLAWYLGIPSVTSLPKSLDGAIIGQGKRKPAAARSHQQRLSSIKRKYSKFRQSPARFFRDSQHHWLRKLGGLIAQGHTGKP